MRIITEVKGQPITRSLITSFISYLLDLFLKEEIKGIMIDKNSIVIQLKEEEE